MPRKKLQPNSASFASGGSLAERAYANIKDRILSLELRPGLFLNEAMLCELTELGRMPVHQAVHRLQSEGLLEVIPRKGLVICSASPDDVLALLEARAAIDPNVAALAAQRAGKEHLTGLKSLLNQSRRLIKQAQTRPQRQEFLVQYRAFHSLIADSIGNKILADAQRPLLERSVVLWQLSLLHEGGLSMTQSEHESILDSIVRHDTVGAHDAMQAHLSNLSKRILDGSLR